MLLSHLILILRWFFSYCILLSQWFFWQLEIIFSFIFEYRICRWIYFVWYSYLIPRYYKTVWYFNLWWCYPNRGNPNLVFVGSYSFTIRFMSDIRYCGPIKRWIRWCLLGRSFDLVVCSKCKYGRMS